jgi:hypothetical protein
MKLTVIAHRLLRGLSKVIIVKGLCKL